MHSLVPQETISLFESKLSRINNPHLMNLEDLAKTIFSSTSEFNDHYGLTRAIASLTLFPWPHEVEQLKEICCGTRALYRFLFGNFLKERFDLDYNVVFLLDDVHAKVGVYKDEESYVLDHTHQITPPRENDSSSQL